MREGTLTSGGWMLNSNLSPTKVTKLKNWMPSWAWCFSWF